MISNLGNSKIFNNKLIHLLSLSFILLFISAKILPCHVCNQSMIAKLLMLVRDPDYRVRFFLARRIGVLFETWDGHVDLFQDVW